MATLTEYLAALEARTEVIKVGPAVPVVRGIQDYYNPDGTVNQAQIDADDNLRKRAGLAVRRRVHFYRSDNDGKAREVALDFAVLDLGGPGETVIEEAGGTAKEPPDPETVFRQQAETWLDANAKTIDSAIVKWWIASVDEAQQVARVMTIYDDGVGGYKEQPFIALRDGGIVSLRKDTTGG